MGARAVMRNKKGGKERRSSKDGNGQAKALVVTVYLYVSVGVWGRRE